MLTALIHAKTTSGALAVTLSSLVPAVAEGLVSHAVVVMAAADPDAERIADAMGASVVIAPSGHWQAAALTARGAWVLLLEAGETPGHDWIAAIEQHLLLQSSAHQRPALLPSAGFSAAFGERLAVMATPHRLRSGLVSPRSAVADGGSGGVPVQLTASRKRMPL